MSPSAPWCRAGPADLAGADSTVGLLINTWSRREPAPPRPPRRLAAELLDQLHRAHNDTLEHEHLALTEEIHHLANQRATVHTLFLYESYPIDTAAFMGVQS